MKKVITYGTFDLLHYGHIRILERAKALGDYLIVGITSDDFDKRRGKINVKQSLAERYKGVEKTGFADEIIVEEYEGQKIDDIIKYGIDIFTVGSDWKGKFDYLNEYCEVKYLPRTKNISSSKIRSNNYSLKIGAVGSIEPVKKHIKESKYVNGIDFVSVFSNNEIDMKFLCKYNIRNVNSYDELLENVDAIYIGTNAKEHYIYIKKALENKKHVLCESPITLNVSEYDELYNLAKNNNVIMMDALKTKYSPAFNRLMLLVKSGTIGKVVSVDCNCTSLYQKEKLGFKKLLKRENSINSWGPTALLPIFEIYGAEYKNKNIVTWTDKKNKEFDFFTKIDFIYTNGIASMKVGKGAKSEGELIISGTEGYIYVPAPWWKTEYFEIRYENSNINKRYFYQLEGEGIIHELMSFLKNIEKNSKKILYEEKFSKYVVSIIEDFYNKDNVIEINIDENM